MDFILETDRLLMRPLVLTDVDAFFAMNDNPNVNQYLRNPLQSKEATERYIQKIISEYETNGIGRFAVTLKSTGELIGFSGLKFRNTVENNHADFYDLGYRFAEQHWRKGYATESANAWLHYGFDTMELPIIYACAVTDNIGSNAVLRKLGFDFTNEYLVGTTPHSWYKLENKL